jgi:putative transposase
VGQTGVTLELVAPPAGTKGFLVVRRRWVVERSIAWMGRYRRLSKDDEAMVETSDAMIQAPFYDTILRKLVRLNTS